MEVKITRNLEIAKRELKERNLSLIIVKDGKIIFESKLQGIAGLIRAIDSLGDLLHSSSAADKVVGRAAALLMAYSHISEVYAATISIEGLRTLTEHYIRVEYDSLVPRIMNKRGDDICPFEKACIGIQSPKEAYIRLKGILNS
jgi:hypothetical protein